ncbi:hypothetical protein QUA27_25225 [Microcoleus sp. Pol14C6]|uniref:hypothetical protein n=1 Tax=unclassified Microcoleus TaxID=2642155 RepID=UPI002FD41076
MNQVRVTSERSHSIETYAAVEKLQPTFRPLSVRVISNPPFIGIIHLSSLPLYPLRSLWFKHSDLTGIDIKGPDVGCKTPEK